MGQANPYQKSLSYIRFETGVNKNMHAITHHDYLEHECQDLLSLYDGMYVCRD